jgi:hypothetical protein
MLEGFFAVVVFLLDVYAIARTIGSDASTRNKVIWVVAIFLLPVVGFIAWLLFGPSGGGRRYSRA